MYVAGEINIIFTCLYTCNRNNNCSMGAGMMFYGAYDGGKNGIYSPFSNWGFLVTIGGSIIMAIGFIINKMK